MGLGLGAGWGERVQPDTQTLASLSGTFKDKNFLFFLPFLLHQTLCSNKSGVGNAKISCVEVNKEQEVFQLHAVETQP